MLTPDLWENEFDDKQAILIDQWWDSLHPDEQLELRELSTLDDWLPSFPFVLRDEVENQNLEEFDDRYEYYVNHELRPCDHGFFDGLISLPGIALLAPLWPPYESETRFSAWSLTDELWNQLQSEYQRQRRDPFVTDHGRD